MSALTDLLNDDSKRKAVIDDCCRVLDDEVADKSGLSGMAIKAGYKAVKGVKPGFIPQVVEDLLPDFVRAIEPTYEEAKGKGASVKSYFADHADRVAESLLAITDRRAERAKRGLVKSTYDKLRPTAKKHVAAAIPRVGALIEKHAPA